MERITYHEAWVVNNCGSNTRILATSHDELWAKIEAGQERGLWGTVICTETFEGIDWAKENAKLQEYLRRKLAGEKDPLPERDAILIEEARALPDEEYDKIVPSAALTREGEDALREVRSEKLNAICWREFKKALADGRAYSAK